MPDNPRRLSPQKLRACHMANRARWGNITPVGKTVQVRASERAAQAIRAHATAHHIPASKALDDLLFGDAP